MNTTDAKRALRALMRERRAVAKAQEAGAAERVRNHALTFLPDLCATKTVAFYSPHDTELDPTPLAQALAARGHHLCLPVVVAKGEPLQFRAYNFGDSLQPSAWAIPEPLPDAAQVEPDILLVPLLGFDRRGFRLGYGGGYYDRTLAALKTKKATLTLGLAYAAQEAEHIPSTLHDIPLDAVATEHKIIVFS